MTDKKEEPTGPATYEGWYTRLMCPFCEDIFEVEGDVCNGETVYCDQCPAVLTVEGR